ncbi:MAG TPA: carboxypeptidase regulatory-like domain-containing protein [Vicinamibacterales bacterium]
MLRRLRWFAVVVSVALAPLAAVPAFGQGTAASIIGRVTDQTGAVLPGVTVNATSPALQVPQVTVVTNEVGEYRLAPLPIGAYEVAFDLPGFTAVRRQEIRLTVGFTARVDVVLGVAAVGETVTVSGAAPIVDVTTTSGSTQLTNEILELSATPRNGVLSVLTLAPGVRTFVEVGGGSMMLENPNPRAHGVGGSQWYTLDGIAARTTNQSVSWDFQTFDEVRIQTLAGDAEQPTRGVQITAVVKSGGNDFHGGGRWSGTNKSFEGTNIDAELEAIGITSGDRLDSQSDLGGELGGRIIRDRVWFYSAARRRRAAYDVLQTFQPDGSPGQLLNRERVFTNKVSFQATPSNRFIFLNMWENGPEQKGLNESIAYESREFKNNGRTNTKIEWEGVRGNALIANLQLGHTRNKSGSPFLNDPALVGRSDLETGRVSGDNPVAGEHSYNRTYHTRGSVSWYKPNWGYGNHEFKSGFDYNADTNEFPGLLAKPHNYHLQYADGVPDQVAFFNAPVIPHRVANVLGMYVKDSWTVGRRLTLNLGVRYSHESVFIPEGCRETATFPSDVMFPAGCFDTVQLPIQNSVVPRLHAAYDLSGDGRTVVKGGWGRYGFRREVALGARYDPNAIAYGIFRWRDLNGNNDWDVGETNRDPNGPDFVETLGTEFEDLPPRFVPNPNEKQVIFDEFSLSFEHELMANFSLRATGIYSQTKNVLRQLNTFRPYEAYNIPVTNRDPGPDGRLGTADDGGLFTYFEFSPGLAGRQFEQFTPVNDSRANMHFSTIEVAAVKRLANRWQLVASYSATKKNWPIGAQGSASSLGFGTASPTFSAAGEHVGFFTPNAEIFSTDTTWDWDGKLIGTYILPADVAVSGNFHHTSGDPFARQVRFTGGRTIPSIVLNVEPIGTHRRPNLNLVQVRVEKRFPLPRAHSATVALDVYNALNANTATGLQNRSGAEFLRPRSIMPPRLAEVGISYRF